MTLRLSNAPQQPEIGNSMAQTPDSNRHAPAGRNPQAKRSTDPGSDALIDDEDEEVWAPSSWDLRQGLDVAELTELPAEWPDMHAAPNVAKP